MFLDRCNKSCTALMRKKLFSISLHNMRLQSFLFIRYIDSIIISDLCPERIKFLHDRHLEDTFINTARIYMYIFLDIDIRSYSCYRRWQKTDCAFSRAHEARNEITRWWSNRQDRTKAQIIRYILSNMNRSLSSRIYRWLLSEIYEVFHPSSKCTLLINWKRKYARFISFGHKYDIIEDMEETKPWIWVWLPQMKYVPL